MGLFKHNEIKCAVCKENSGNKKYTISDGVLCEVCHWKIVGLLNFSETYSEFSSDTVKDYIAMGEKFAELEKKFDPNYSVGDYFFIDEKNKLWGFDLSGGTPKLQPSVKKRRKIYTFGEIESFELIKNGQSVITGGIGSTLVGGALFGSAGAVAGSSIGKKNVKNTVGMFKIKVELTDSFRPVYIDLIRELGQINMAEASPLYIKAFNQAQEIMTALEKIAQGNTAQKETEGKYSISDEIIKLKELLDKGIITDDEFKMAKLKLLS